MEPEEGGEADEDAYGETGGNMAWMTVEGEDFLEARFPGLDIQQSLSPAGK
jgi:hypothetical protein